MCWPMQWVGNMNSTIVTQHSQHTVAVFGAGTAFLYSHSPRGGGWKEKAQASVWVDQPGDYPNLLTISARTPTRLRSAWSCSPSRWYMPTEDGAEVFMRRCDDIAERCPIAV